MAGRESSYFHPEPGLRMELYLNSPISLNGVGSVQPLLGKEEEVVVVVVVVVMVVVVVVVVVNTRSLCITRDSLSSYSMLDRRVR